MRLTTVGQHLLEQSSAVYGRLMAPQPRVSAPYYANGQWSQVEDPIGTVLRQRPALGWESALTAVDFSLWHHAGPPEDDEDHGGLRYNVYSRSGAPHFVLLVDGGEGGALHPVYAATVCDVMDLLARWAPVVQQGLLDQVLHSLNQMASSSRHSARSLNAAEEHLAKAIRYLKAIGNK